jgi:phosphomevalonate kinase
MQKKIYSMVLLVLCTSIISSCKKNYLESDQYFKDRITIEKVFKSKVYTEEWLAHVFEELKGENVDVASKGLTPHNFADDMYYGDRDRDFDPSKNELSYNMFKMGFILKMINKAVGPSVIEVFAMQLPLFIMYI